jgi:hypothetical protein
MSDRDWLEEKRNVLSRLFDAAFGRHEASSHLEFSDCGGVLATEQALCRNRRYRMETLLHVIEIWGGVNGVLVLLLLGRRPRRSHVLVAGRPVPAHGPHDGTDADVTL